MPGSGLIWKIVIALVIAAAAIGYFKYTQDKMAELNQQIATKDFALKTANATIEKQQEDFKRQQEILENTNAAYEKARSNLSELEEKFSREGKSLDQLAKEKPEEIEKKVNAATKRVFNCLEGIVNTGKENENC